MGFVQDHWERRPDGADVRVLRDSRTGRRWRVWPLDVVADGGAPSRCLVYDGGDVLRRCWRVPDDWGRMPPAALMALPEHAGDVATGDGRSAAEDRPPRRTAEPRTP